MNGERRFLLAVALLAVWVAGGSLRASAEERLIDQEPFDLVTLDAANENAELKVAPLDLPKGRRVPVQLEKRAGAALIMHLLDRPGETYEVKWTWIDKIELYEQMVLDEANRLAKSRELDEAFEYFKFLRHNYPEWPGVDEGLNDYLYEEAKELHRQRQYDAALAVLRDLRARQPDRPELDKALGMTTEKLVEKHAAEGSYAAARTLLGGLAAFDPQHPVVVKWEADFREKASRLLADAREAVEANHLRKADELTRQLALVWPSLPGAKEFAASLHKRYATVVVAVTVPSPVDRPDEEDAWASRRVGRLLNRKITEFVGPGSEGGRYICPLGTMETQELGLRLAFRLRPDMHWSTGTAAMTGVDLSQRLLTLANPAEPNYSVQWAELLAAASVRDVYSVQVDLTRPHVRPEAFLQTTVAPFGVSVDGSSGWTNGPYVLESQSDGEDVFLTNPRYFAADPEQPKAIVERYFAQGAKAIWDLEHRRVDVVDRVNPWDLEKVEELKDVVVESYAMPLIHCLVPNMRKPLVANRLFRRALVYGIHREAILNRLLGGVPRQGCQVVSGPFSPGMSRDDPLGYAYDVWIEPRGYEPQLAIALAQIAMQELRSKKENQAEKDASASGLVLAYPPDEIARRASTEIQRQLGLLGFRITLRELPPGAGSRMPDDVDLLYAELAVREPVVDARRLLDYDGLVGGASPYMTQALRRLDEASDWVEVADRLHQIHRLAHQEVSLIPLWQLTDYFAYHRSLHGTGGDPVSLYQNVEEWRPSFYYPAGGR